MARVPSDILASRLGEECPFLWGFFLRKILHLHDTPLIGPPESCSDIQATCAVPFRVSLNAEVPAVEMYEQGPRASWLCPAPGHPVHLAQELNPLRLLVSTSQNPNRNWESAADFVKIQIQLSRRSGAKPGSIFLRSTSDVKVCKVHLGNQVLKTSKCSL